MSEVAVVGGGLAGGAAAALLAAGGRRALLIEREAEPVDKICGEFLSGEAQRLLGKTGLDLARLGGAPIGTLRLAWRGRTIETGLPFAALGLTRRRLDAALLDHAAACGAAIERGVAARGITGRRVETTAGTITPDTLLLASGKHEVRGATREAGRHAGDFVGFKMHWRLPHPAIERLRGMIDVALFEGGYAGLQLVEKEVANLCLVVRKPRLAALGGTWPALLAALLREPQLARLLADGEPLLPKPLTIGGVPYGFLQRDADVEGRYRLGDQAAVIPSFCGEGMAIALHSADLAARHILAGGTARAYQRRLHADLARPIAVATRLQRAGAGAALPWLWGALRLAPGIARLLARATRIPN